MHHRLFLVIAAISGCARGVQVLDEPDAGPGGGPASVDAKVSVVDAPDGQPPSDAPPAMAAAPLLLTEIVLTPSVGEYIELANPASQPVDLSSYYLADAGAYFRLPVSAPIVDAADFIVKFPAGASIPAKGVITVALDTAANFTTTYGTAPTYSVASGTMTSVAANGVASLTNGGELVVLFRWDGQGDLVRDVDMVLAGVPSVANSIVDKSGVMLDGPDANVTATAYATDSRTLAPQATAAGVGVSTKRISLEAGHELQTGSGNGLTGDDETSEDTTSTWDTAFSAPTPGTIPTGLVP